MAVCTTSEGSAAINMGKSENITYGHNHCFVMTNDLNYPKPGAIFIVLLVSGIGRNKHVFFCFVFSG